MYKSMSISEFEAEKSNKRTAVDNIFSNILGMKIDQKKITETGNFAYAYDNNFEKLCVIAWNSMNNDFDIDVLETDKIKTIEIGTTNFTKEVHVSGTKLGSALIGGALLGGGGALIGAMLGQQGGKKNESYAMYQLQIATSDPKISNISHTLRMGTDADEVKDWVATFRGFLNTKKFSIGADKQKIAPDSRECPMCAETIKAKAKLCRFCGCNIEDESGKLFDSLKNDPNYAIALRIEDQVELGNKNQNSNDERQYSKNEILCVLKNCIDNNYYHPDGKLSMLNKAIKNVDPEISPVHLRSWMTRGFNFFLDEPRGDISIINDEFIVMKKIVKERKIRKSL